MIVREIAQHIYMVPLGFVNVFLLDYQGLTLIDTGVKGSDKTILKAIQELGRSPQELHSILITHVHADHTGGLAALKQSTDALVYMHALDADAFQNGAVMRSIQPAASLVSRLIVKVIQSQQRKQKHANGAETVIVDQKLYGGEVIPDAGGLRAIHAPGHTLGHLIFYQPDNGGTIFLGDAAANMLRLGYSILYENFAEGQDTLRKISQMNFNCAGFSHGKAILAEADRKFKQHFI